MQRTGIILAGGKSSRMGVDKGLIPINGKPMIEFVIDAIRTQVDQIIIIANTKEYEQFGLPVFSDLVDAKGPVGGIYTGLSYSKTDNNLVLSCDGPLINENMIKKMLLHSSNKAVSIARFQTKSYPLFGCYRKDIKEDFKLSLEKNELKLQSLNEKIGCDYVNFSPEEFEEKLFWNVNTKSDLEKFKNEVKS